MKIVFIRHGEPDKAELLESCQVIVSSPYTRALQTAAILSKNTGLDIKVEVDIHEFIPDKTFQVKGEDEDKILHRDFMNCLGEYPEGEVRKWETITEIINRSRRVFDKYVDLGYERIIVVAHGGVIRRYTGEGFIEHCGICEVDYSKDFTCFGWV